MLHVTIVEFNLTVCHVEFLTLAVRLVTLPVLALVIS